MIREAVDILVEHVPEHTRVLSHLCDAGPADIVGLCAALLLGKACEHAALGGLKQIMSVCLSNHGFMVWEM